MSKKVIISVNETDKNNAGPKAKTDIDKILKEKENFQVINLAFKWHSKFLKMRYITWDIPHLMRNINADEIFFQFPSYSRTLMDSFVNEVNSSCLPFLSLCIFFSNGLYFFSIKNNINIINGWR